MICPQSGIALPAEGIDQEIGTSATQTIGQHAKKCLLS